MDPQLESWVTETQSTLKGVTTTSLKGQHSRLRRAKARENWYNTGVSNDGRLIQPFKFVDQQELRCQNNSKLLSSIRSHVKQDNYMKRQTTKAGLGNKKHPHHIHVLPKRGPIMQSRVEFRASHSPENDEAALHPLQRHDVRRGCLSLSTMRSKTARSSVFWNNGPFNTYTGYDPLNRPRSLFLLSHCNYHLISSRIHWIMC
jgi:hypothetical protein